MVSDNLFQLLVEGILWWPSFVADLTIIFLDLVLFENTPNFFAERVVLFDQSGTFSTLSQRYRMSTTGMLFDKFGKIEFLTVDDPVIRVNFLGVRWIPAAEPGGFGI